jgi:D-lactate dehydrogenase
MTRLYFYDIQEAEKEPLQRSLTHLEPVYIEQPIRLDLVHEDAEIVSLFVSSTLTREMIDKMPNLKLVVTRSTGFDHIDIQALSERTIPVLNVPSYGEHTVAEYGFGLLLGLTRKIPIATKMTRENVCVPPEEVRGVDLSGKTLVVVGAGRIGRKMIAMGRGFGMNVLAYDPHEDAASATSLGFRYAPLEEVLRASDVISLHMPATPENHHMISRDVLQHVVKKGVYIINTARGELIDTEALIEALQGGIVAGAGLDVCEGEELLKRRCSIEVFNAANSTELLKESAHISILKSLPNVLLTPHIAYDTVEALGRICDTTASNIQSFLQGTIVNQVKSGVKPFGKLILIRHAESEWNAQGMWTGTRDKHLTDKGFQDARVLGTIIEDIHIDHAFASTQLRTIETLSSILGTMHQLTVPISRDSSLNERDYGDYTGKNKHEMKEILGEEQFEKVRRGWNVPIPNGETLEMVYNRTVPYYQSSIVPRLQKGENVLIVSHGNALRALMKYIESLSDEQIEHTEMMFGGAVVYTVNEQGLMTHKETRETPSLSYDHV